MKRGPLLFVLSTIFLDMVAIGLFIPSTTRLMRRFTDDPAQVSLLIGWFSATYALAQFLAAPLLGWLSDQYGRRPVLLVSLFVTGLDYVVMALAPTQLILFVGRAIAGVTGATLPVAMACIADLTPPERRAAAYGLTGAAFGLGFIIGPAAGALLAEMSPQAPFFAAAALAFINLGLGFLVFPETLPASKRTRHVFALQNLNPLASVQRVLRMPGLLPLLVVHILSQLSGQVHPSIWTIYTETRYGWSPREIGASLALVGLLSALAQGLLTKHFLALLGSERRAVLIAFLGLTVGYISYGLASQSWVLIATLLLTFPFWCGGPALQSLITQSTSEGQGELQGALVALTSVASIVTPMVSTSLFSATVDSAGGSGILLGAPYFYAATCAAVAFFVLLLTQTRKC